MAQSLQSLIVENQRLQAQITLLKNAAINVRDDLLERAELARQELGCDTVVVDCTINIWDEFKECINSTPQYATQAIGMAAIQDFAMWQGQNMEAIMAGYISAVQDAQERRKAPPKLETVQ